MSGCRTLVLEARPVRRQRLLALIADIPQLLPAEGCASLMEAYTRIEEEQPDLVLIGGRLSAAPEHAMLEELMRMLGIDSILLDEALDDAVLLTLLRQRRRRIGRPQTRMAARQVTRQVTRLSFGAAWPSASPADPGPAGSAPVPAAPPGSAGAAVSGVSAGTAGEGGRVSASPPVPRGMVEVGRVSRPGPESTAQRLENTAIPASAAVASSADAAPISPAASAARGAILLIGASTGGVEALHQLLGRLPADCPPVVVVQHIRGAFSSAFAERLNRVCAPQVLEARDGMALSAGQVLVAPGAETHLQLFGRHPVQARLVRGDPVTGHRPSVDALFTSALPLAGRVVAALLTGMGQDGARGLLALRQAGAHTIAQDQESSTVFGMPRVAAELGAACEILPLRAVAGSMIAAAGGLSQRGLAGDAG